MQAKVEWEDVARVAPAIFEIWVDGREVEWAQLAWQSLRKVGLTSYRTELERTKVLTRFLLLGRLYREFCAMAWEEWQEPDWYDWADELEISVFRVAQLLGDEEIDDNGSDSELLEEALALVAEREREAVAEALLKGFGGEIKLFASLWATNWNPEEAGEYSDSEDDEERDGDEGRPQQTLAQILQDDDLVGEICYVETLGDLMEGKGPAFEWVSEGMDSINFAR